ncbi:MAG: cyclase [Flavobacterium sp.]|jgi:cyclase
MLKRLIGVITVKNNWAVQSIGYKKYLPLGRPEVIAENYDRWLLDEIIVVDIDRSKYNLGPNFELLKKITSKALMTPLCYMGGIRDSSDALELIRKGADRVAIDSLFRKEPDSVSEIVDAIGRQAVIRVQPALIEGRDVLGYDHLTRCSTGIIDTQKLVDDQLNFSELMIVDVENEGGMDSFSTELVDYFERINLQLICFGGVTSAQKIGCLFSKTNVSAVAIGNSLSYREMPHKSLLTQTEVDRARVTSFGETTKGAKEW